MLMLPMKSQAKIWSTCLKVSFKCFGYGRILNWMDTMKQVISSNWFSAGNQYWGIRAYAKTIMPGYPKPLTALGLPSSVRKVDAAVYVPRTGKTLIFVNNQYWRWVFVNDQVCMFFNKAHTLWKIKCKYKSVRYLLRTTTYLQSFCYSFYFFPSQLWWPQKPNGQGIPTIHLLGFPWHRLQSGCRLWELRWETLFTLLV